jgi:iron complex transport system permease protein
MPVRRLALCLLLLSVLLVLLASSMGSTGWDSVLSARQDPVVWQIVWDIRLPRAWGAWLAGALLGLAGAVAQGLFRNPLADPYLLGSASGASLGVGMGLVWLSALPAAGLWWAYIGLTGAAFVGAVGAVLLTLLLAGGAAQPLRLLLAGVVVGVVVGALGQLIMMMRPEVLLSMQSFLWGSTSFVGWEACAIMTVALLVCLLLAVALSSLLDGLSLGEATATSLGLPLVRARAVLVMVLALATGAAVAHTGLIGFVGLAAPHLVRSLAPSAYRYFIVLSALMGAVLLLSADTLARSLIAPQELPVGVLTAVLGGGYLLWLMHRSGQRRGRL